MPKRFALLILLNLSVITDFGQGRNHLSAGPASYQRAIELYNSKNPTDRIDSLSLVYFKEAIDELEKSKSGDSTLFDSYTKAGILATTRKDDQAALDFMLRAIRLQQRTITIPDSLTFKAKLFAGSAYYNLNDLDSAQYYYLLAEELIEKYSELEEPERLYNKAGVLYYEMGDYRKSIQYFTKALSLIEYGAANNYFLVNYKNNIASALRKLGDYDQALKIYKSLLLYKINQNELFHNIGVTYLDAGKYREAIQWLKKVNYNSQSKYNDIGRAWLLSNLPDSAAHYFELAIRSYDPVHSTKKNYDYGMTLKWMGELMLKKNLPSKALALFQGAAIQLDPAFNDTALEKNPGSFKGLVNSFALFDILVSKANAFQFLYNQQKKIEMLRSSFSTYGSALVLAEQVEKEFSSQEARLFLANSVGPAYQAAISTGVLLYQLSNQKKDLQDIFKYIESNKASVLQAGLHELKIESLAGLPGELISEEKKLKSSIAKTNIQIRNETEKEEIDILERRMIDEEIRLGAIQDQLQKNPKYLQLKFGSQSNSIDSIQHEILPHDAVLLSYYYLKNSLICFYINHDDYGIKETPIDNRLRDAIFSLRRSLGAVDGADQRKIRESQSFIFNQLIAPVLSQIQSYKRLIIIPNNEISYIPFEILVDPKTDELLLRRFSVSYQYSANFLDGENDNEFRNYDVLAMAPFADPNSGTGLSWLEYSKKEVENLPGKLLIDSMATKEAFIKSSAGFPILHLATHAVANDQDPLQSYIEFYLGGREADTVHRLYEPEIYHLDLASVRLVLLSACETGHGKLVNGEGIMSLSRAFSYAGCKSVITSLWKADDAATAFIMQKLHAYLQDGMSKDDALRKAKLDYLDNGEIEPPHKSASFWAQFVLIGDPQVMHPKNQWPPWLIGGLILLVLLFLLLRKKPGPIKGPAKYS